MAQSLALRKRLAEIAEANRKFDREVDVAEAARVTGQANQQPSCKWRGITLACGTRRQRLYVNGAETPYFVDSANGILAHRTQGSEHGLFGAGMHECKIRDREGNPRYIAAILGSGKQVAVLKHRAEQMALARLDERAALTRAVVGTGGTRETH